MQNNITKELLKLLKSVFILLVLFLGVDKGFGIIMDELYFKQGRSYLYGIEEANEDVLIFGASRAMHHYVPSIIEDSLQLTCFNLGSGGQNIYYHYGLIKAVLARYSPKIIILDLFDIDYYDTPGWNTEKLSAFNPVYYRDTIIKEMVELRGKTEKIKLFSSFYRYNGEVIRTINRAVRHNNTYFNTKNKGYTPLEGQWKENKQSLHRENNRIDSLKVYYIKKCIALCKAKGVPIILFTSPHYIDMGDDNRYLLHTIAKEYQISYFNYEQSENFLIHSEYFRDIVHLNHKGAEIYTKMIIADINKIK